MTFFQKVRNNARLIGFCIALVYLYPMIACPYARAAEHLNFFRIGTGGQTGVYYPIGKLIARGISIQASAVAPNVQAAEEQKEMDHLGNAPKATRPLIGIAQNSGGSIDNVRGIIAGEIQAGLVQADIAAWAYQGKNVFWGDNESQNIRAVASLYPEKLQIVVRRDANILTVNHLRGKRFSVDESGSGTLAVMRIVLGAHGLNETHLDPVYLKPVFTHEKIVQGSLQGFAIMAGGPMEAVNQLVDCGISLVPIAPEMASQITEDNPFLTAGIIPANLYPGIPETPTIQVHALLVVNKTLDPALVYKITSALWAEQTRSLLHQGHPQGKSITRATALTGISIPLHRGAAQYYKDHPEGFAGPALK